MYFRVFPHGLIFVLSCVFQVYLARVKGHFPGNLSHLRELNSIDFDFIGTDAADNDGDGDAEGGGEGGGGGGGNNKKRPSNSSVNIDFVDSNSSGNKSKQLRMDYGSGKDIQVESLPAMSKPIMSPQDIGKAPGVGYKYLPDEIDHSKSASSSSSSTTTPQATSSDSNSNGDASNVKQTQQQVLWLQCPIGVVSYRDGIHACDPDGKISLSGFRSLGYHAETDTSLVECRPYSGRTHQLRLHLQLLGSPIANDPCYGGTLFYGDDQRRAQALTALRTMRAKGAVPLSKVPHLNDPELDAEIAAVAAAAAASTSGDGCGDSVTSSEVCSTCTVGAAAAAADTVVSPPMLAAAEGGAACCEAASVVVPAANPDDILEGETDDEYLVRTCRYSVVASVCVC